MKMNQARAPIPLPDRASHIVSGTFFISQLAAIGLFALTGVAADLSAGDYSGAILLVAAIALLAGAIWVFRLPATFARRLSPGALSVGAILYSVFAVLLAYSEASGFGDLPPDVLARPTMQYLRLGGGLALAAFALALVANLIAAVVALRNRS
jgi:hypothetical protein